MLAVLERRSLESNPGASPREAAENCAGKRQQPEVGVGGPGLPE